jgi:cyclopropane fatty-acyl-phospholipid synthase-like methyltransferase
MVNNPVHQSQLYLRRRAGLLLRGRGLLPAANHERQHLEGAARDRFFETGYKQVATLTARIEAHTGCTLEGRRALEYGCGVGRMTVPLAERCEHVYGLDVSPSMLTAADRNAKRMGVSNVEWLEADRVAELGGRYDLVLSLFVFQHIHPREGERIFAALVRGLRPGGVGAIHFTLRPSRPLSGFFRGEGKSVRLAKAPWSHMYMLMNSYSLNRLGKVLADEGVNEWHARWLGPYPAATLVFRKDR